MGVVIRMNMAAGLGRAVLSWAQAVERNRCLLTHICRACWDFGVSGRGSDHLRDTVHLGPWRSLAHSVPWKLSVSLLLLSLLPACLPVVPTNTHTHKHLQWHKYTYFWHKDRVSDSDLKIKGFDQPTLRYCDRWSMRTRSNTTLKLKGKLDGALARIC